MAYGLEVYNPSGTTRLSITDRVIRLVGTGTVTVNRNSYVDVTVTGMANNDSWIVGFTTSVYEGWMDPPGDYNFTKSTNNLRISYSVAYVSQYTPASKSIIYYVFKS